MSNSLPNLSLILAGVALILALYGAWQSFALARLKKTFFAGSKGIDLESTIISLQEQLKDSQRQQTVLEQNLLGLQNTLSFAVQRVGLVRFNPFSDGGGNFSFSLALLNSNRTGVIITSMYGREQNRIYTKKIEAGTSESQLTQEEQQAITIANSKI
jgi:hypothetical protein